MLGLGTILNVVCILVGGATGLALSRQMSPKTHLTLKGMLAVISLVAGVGMIWSGLVGDFPMRLTSASVAEGGTGYREGDTLWIHGGKMAQSAAVKVSSVADLEGRPGVIHAVEVLETGAYSAPPQSPALAIGRAGGAISGAGAQFALSFHEKTRPWGKRFKGFALMMAALMVGHLLGHLLGIQKRLNEMGKWARKKFTSAAINPDEKYPPSDGFITCTLLFCVGPMAFLGPIQDGLAGDIKTLAIKSAMDGISTMTFAATFGWGVMLSVLPVIAYQGTLTLLAAAIKNWLDHLPQAPLLLDSVNATGGFMVMCIPFLLLELRKVQLADYLPALLIAPLIAWHFW